MLTACYVVHNEADELAASILSVKAYVDRLVIVDCAFTSNPVESVGSSDGTREVAETACEGTPLTWIAPPSKLPEHEARNLYLEAVSAGWILLMDADERLFAEHDYMVRLAGDLAGITSESLQVRVFTTAVLANANADEIDAELYARSPRITTAGWMPKLVRWTPWLRHERRGVDHHGIYADGDELGGIRLEDVLIVNDHAGQSHAAYQHDFVWEMAQR